MINKNLIRNFLASISNLLSKSKDYSRQFRWLLFGALIFANILVFVVIQYSLSVTKNQYELRAISLAQNVSNAVDQNVSHSIEKVDLVLLDLKKEVSRELTARKKLDEQGLSALMDEWEVRLPEVENFRIVNEDGVIVLGRQLDPFKKYSVADRDYFIHHKNHDDGSLQISKPVLGRVINKPLITLSRRINYSNGRFAGIVYATITTDFFTALLKNYDLGVNGTLVLRDQDLGLITRLPAILDDPAGQIGNANASPELHEQVDRGIRAGTILNSHGSDGLPRIVTFRYLENAPIIVIAGVSPKDYLSTFNQQTKIGWLVALSYLVISLIFGLLIFRVFNASRRFQESLFETQGYLQNERQLNAAIVESSNDAIIGITLGGIISTWNSAAEKLYGYSEDAAIGQSISILIHKDSKENLTELMDRVKRGDSIEHYRAYRMRKDGRQIPILCSLSPIKNGQGQVVGLSTVGHDVSEQVRLEQQIRQMSFYDPLTNLANRRLLDERISREFVANRRNGCHGALIYIDLDNFKTVNDAYGRNVGDALLVKVSIRLKTCVREMDTVSRVGGDEFAVLITGLEKDPAIVREHIGAIAEKIRDLLAEPYGLDVVQTDQSILSLQHHCSVSIGVVMFSGDQKSNEELLNQADQAMYKAKEAGRNTVQYYDPGNLS